MPDEPAAGGGRTWIGWLAGTAAVYGALFGVGKALLGPRWEAVPFLVGSALAFAVAAGSLSSRDARQAVAAADHLGLLGRDD